MVVMGLLIGAALFGACVAVTYTVVYLAVLLLSWIVDYAKNKIAANNRNKILAVETEKILSPSKMKEIVNSATSDQTFSVADMESFVKEHPVITAVVSDESEEAEIQAIKTNKVDNNLKDLLKQKNGKIVLTA